MARDFSVIKTYENEKEIAEAIKERIDTTVPSFRNGAMNASRTVDEAIYGISPIVPEDVKEMPGYEQATCVPTMDEHGMLCGITHEYTFENEDYSCDTATETYKLSPETISELNDYAQQKIDRDYADIAAMDPGIIQYIDSYGMNPEAKYDELTSKGYGDLAERMDEALDRENYRGLSVAEAYVEQIRNAYPVAAEISERMNSEMNIGEDALTEDAEL